MAAAGIDWEQLKHRQGAVPWAAIEAAVEAVAAEPARWEELAQEYDAFIHQGEAARSFEGIYIPVILSQVVGRVPTAVGDGIIRFLLARLDRAGKAGDDGLLDVLREAIVRVGPRALPMVLRRLQTLEPEDGAWIHTWSLVEIAAEEGVEAGLRGKAVEASLELLREVEGGKLKAGDAMGALWLLTDLGNTEAAGLIESTLRTHGEELDEQMMRREYEHALATLQGKEERLAPGPMRLRESVEATQQTWRKAYARWEREERVDASEAVAGEETMEPVAPIVRTQPKVGRNDPCPCGSGKKYKKCCGR